MDDVLVKYEDIEESITKELTKELNDQINKKILESLSKLSDPDFERKKIFNQAIEYKDKFKIISNSPMNYVLFTFINELIKSDIKNGYITHKYKDAFDKEYISKYKLDDLESVTYIYDNAFGENKIIRWHRYKTGEKEENEPIYIPYNILNNVETINNYKSNSKYIVGPGFIPETKYYNTFNIKI